jgi:hypothetical protein
MLVLIFFSCLVMTKCQAELDYFKRPAIVIKFETHQSIALSYMKGSIQW